MKGIFDHEKLCKHKGMVIPLNIFLGKMITELLKGVNPRFLKSVITSLKKEFMEEHDDVLNTEEKKVHVQKILSKIATKKYNFIQGNIEMGQFLNKFYELELVKLPVQYKKFQCIYCKQRRFKKLCDLNKHQKSCRTKNVEEKEKSEMIQQKSEGVEFQKKKETKIDKPKNKKVVKTIKQKSSEKKQRESKERQTRSKRQKPVSSFNLESLIFFGDQ